MKIEKLKEMIDLIDVVQSDLTKNTSRFVPSTSPEVDISAKGDLQPGRISAMIVNGIETTREEEAAMHVAASFLESVARATCGDLADYLAAVFPGIAPRRCLSLAYEAMRIASRGPGVEVRLPGAV